MQIAPPNITTNALTNPVSYREHECPLTFTHPQWSSAATSLERKGELITQEALGYHHTNGQVERVVSHHTLYARSLHSPTPQSTFMVFLELMYPNGSKEVRVHHFNEHNGWINKHYTWFLTMEDARKVWNSNYRDKTVWQVLPYIPW